MLLAAQAHIPRSRLLSASSIWPNSVAGSQLVTLSLKASRNLRNCTAKANDHLVFLYAFDLPEINGRDLRKEPLGERKRRLKNSDKAQG